MDMKSLRREIDQADEALVKAFSRRMAAAGSIAQYKKENGLPLVDSSRERDVISRVTSLVEPEMEMRIKLLYQTLFDLSRSYQQEVIAGDGELKRQILQAAKRTPPMFPRQGMVAYQGMEGAYSQQACDKLFAAPNLWPFKRFEGVFQAIEGGMCQYGVLPIENSTQGSVTEVYDLLLKYRFFIVRSLRLRIEHRLLANPGVELGQIKEVISHEQALGQCSQYLKTLKDVKLTVCENTAVAAKQVAESGRDDLAAIASPGCAGLYGLQVLKSDIANSDSNDTRFICIAKALEIYPGAHRVSLMMTLPHKPGSLYGVMAKFAALGLNLTKLESRPIPGADFSFRFYFDLEASLYDPDALRLLGELSNEAEDFAYLGSYSEI